MNNFVKNIIKEELEKQTVGHKEKYGCLMLQLNNKISNWKQVLKLIDPINIYNDSSNQYGLELEAHCTVLYGFHSNVSVDEVKKLMDEHVNTNITFALTGISLFENKEYSVLKFDVESDELHRLHELCKSLPHTLTFPEYHPHITIGYLKPSTGKEYIKKFKTPFEMEGNTFLYSTPNKEKTSWKIQKKYNFKIDLKKN